MEKDTAPSDVGMELQMQMQKPMANGVLHMPVINTKHELNFEEKIYKEGYFTLRKRTIKCFLLLNFELFMCFYFF